jgi:hypothetical protein
MDLVRAMQTEYSRCKRLLYFWGLPLSITVFVAAIIGCFPVPGGLTNVMAVVVVPVQIAVFILRVLAGEHQGRAEKIRRMAMLQDGMDMKPYPTSLARLREIIGDHDHNEPAFLQPYYGSDETQGPRRLLEITAECAFFTGGNARRMWKIIAVVSVAGLIIAMIAFSAAVLSGATEAVLESAAKIVLASMAFWAAGDFAALAVSFKRLTDTSEAVLSDCEHALTANTAKATLQSSLALFCEYNCAVSQTPPIPGWVYRRFKDRMNQAWRDRDTQCRTGNIAAVEMPGQPALPGP